MSFSNPSFNNNGVNNKALEEINQKLEKMENKIDILTKLITEKNNINTNNNEVKEEKEEYEIVNKEISSVIVNGKPRIIEIPISVSKEPINNVVEETQTEPINSNETFIDINSIVKN